MLHDKLNQIAPAAPAQVTNRKGDWTPEKLLADAGVPLHVL